MVIPLVVVVASERSYVTGDIAIAAERLGIELVFVTDRCHVLAEIWPSSAIAVEMSDPEDAARAACASIAPRTVSAVIGTDEVTAVVAQVIASRMNVAAHKPGAAARAADKLDTREALTHAGLRQPRFTLYRFSDPLPEVSFPVVVKPRCLSASRGVIRADDAAQLAAAIARVQRLLTEPDVRGRHGALAESVLIEEFIVGPEMALDGVLIDGALETVALFDKPRALDGPTFVESLYVLPTALPEERVAEIESACARAAAALGLCEGPIHAELRLGEAEPVVIEIAARSIGGLCGRTLAHAAGRSVADVVLAKLCGLESELAPIVPSGVAMLGPDRDGIFRGVEGVADALAIDGVQSIEITAPVGQRVATLPGASEYLGFVFACARTREAVIAALTEAESLLRADIQPTL